MLDTGCTDSIINKTKTPPSALRELQPLQPPTTITCLNATTVNYTHYIPLTWSFEGNSINHSTNFLISEDPLPASIDMVIGLKAQQNNNFYLNPITNTISTTTTTTTKPSQITPAKITSSPTTTFPSPTPITPSPKDHLYAALDYEVLHIIYDGSRLRVYQVQISNGPCFLADVSIQTRDSRVVKEPNESHLTRSTSTRNGKLLMMIYAISPNRPSHQTCH